MVGVLTDPNSSISTLSVKAFTAQDALRANQVLLERSEALVNRLNERGRQDPIRFAQAEVDQAAARAKTAALALSNYRERRQGVVDPERQATTQLQQVAKLQDELIATTTQLAQLKAVAPKNPQIPALENRAKTLRAEMAKETDKATGGQQSLSNKAAEFQRLALDADFANKQLASALASLGSARNEACAPAGLPGAHSPTQPARCGARATPPAQHCRYLHFGPGGLGHLSMLVAGMCAEHHRIKDPMQNGGLQDAAYSSCNGLRIQLRVTHALILLSRLRAMVATTWGFCGFFLNHDVYSGGGSPVDGYRLASTAASSLSWHLASRATPP